MDEQVAAPHRRGFLGAIAAAAAVIGWSARTDAASPAAAGGGTGFQKWLDSIPGRHRQVYDAPAPNHGFGLIWSHVYLLTAAQGYDVSESELGVVLVLRHSAIPIAMRDDAWAKYRLGEYFRIDDPATKAAALRNPFAFIRPGDMPLPEAALEKLIARNVRVAVCGAAIHHQSMRVAQQSGLDHDSVEKDWLAAVIPGVQVVPSGVLAVNGAQSRGCTYCFAG